MAGYADDLALSHVLADTADSVSMARFRALDLRVDAKPDLSPVSDADTAVERALRGTLARARPRDGVLGEEFGVTDAPAGPGSRQWVIDPIDGTKNFIRGVPIWATLIALMEGDQVMVGMVSAPALGRSRSARRDAGHHPAYLAQPVVRGLLRVHARGRGGGRRHGRAGTVAVG